MCDCCSVFSGELLSNSWAISATHERGGGFSKPLTFYTLSKRRPGEERIFSCFLAKWKVNELIFFLDVKESIR